MGGDAYGAWVTVKSSPVTIKNLKKGKRYSFAVRAVNSVGPGPGTVVTVSVR